MHTHDKHDTIFSCRRNFDSKVENLGLKISILKNIKN